MQICTSGFYNKLLLGTAVALSVSISLHAQAQQSSSIHPSSVHSAVASGTPVRYHTERFPKRAGEYYSFVWGIDSMAVKATESGAVIRFSYRVLDSSKAKTMNDKNVEAFLNVPARHIQLVIPSLEKVGKLRQTGDPETGKSYWMAFSNPRRTVKPGDRVDVVIGKFHAMGLQVE
jgi:hypothetical protein